MHLVTGQVGVDAGTRLTWARLVSPRSWGLVFIPPLIGGGAGGQLGLFRWLTRSGLDLFSYDYTGHGRSGGAFSLGASIRDSRLMMGIAERQAEDAGIPLFGTAACYGAIPLVNGAFHLGEPLKRMVLLNPVPDFSLSALLAGYCRWYFDAARRMAVGGVLAGMRAYMDTLFPFTEKGLSGFGRLRRGRTRLFTVVLEAVRFRPLEALRLNNTRLLCLYAERDVVRQAAGYMDVAAYRRRIRGFCPHTRFHALDDDHYLARRRSRSEIRRLTADFFIAGASGG